MQRHKIAAQIILLILSFINFALAAPVLVRRIREVRVDVAEDVTIASQKRWNPSDKWSTNAPDTTNTPPISASSGSDYWLEQELGPRDPRSPIVLNLSHSSLGSRDSYNSHPSPVPVASPPPAHNNLPDLNVAPQPSVSGNSYSLPVSSPPPAHSRLPLDIDLNLAPQPSVSGNSHPLPVGLPPPAHNNKLLNLDLNATPQPSVSVNSHSLSVGPWPPVHNNLPLDTDSNAAPQRSQESTDGSDSGYHSTGSSTDDYDSASSSRYYSHSMGSGTQSNSYHSTGSETETDVTMSPSAWYEMSVFEFPKSPSTSSSLPPHGNLNMDFDRLSVPTDDQLSRWSSKRPYLPSDDSDPGPSKRPHVPSDPGPSTWAYPPSDPGPSRRPYVPSDPGPSTWAHSPSTSWPDAISPSTWNEMWANWKSPSSSPLHDSNPLPQHGNLDNFLNRPLSGSGPTDGQPSLATQSDPGPSRRPYSPSDSGRSSLSYPQAQSDPGPSRRPFSPLDAGSPTGPIPSSNLGSLEHESENFFSDVFRGRFKRDISGSRYVNAAY